MEYLYHTFLHSIAWHTGTQLAHMVGLPLIVIFIGYGIYRKIKNKKV